MTPEIISRARVAVVLASFVVARPPVRRDFYSIFPLEKTLGFHSNKSTVTIRGSNSALVHEFVSRSKEQRETRQPEREEKECIGVARTEGARERERQRKRDKLLAEFPPLARCTREMSMRRVVVKVTRGAWVSHVTRRADGYSFVRSFSRPVVPSYRTSYSRQRATK